MEDQIADIQERGADRGPRVGSRLAGLGPMGVQKGLYHKSQETGAQWVGEGW